MPVFRVDVLVENPDAVFEWIAENFNDGVVRKIAYHTVKGWFVKVVFKRQADAEKFHRQWLRDSVTHTVAPFR
jgi:hypothetical protein